MSEVKDCVSFTDAEIFVNEDIPRIKNRYSDKISKKNKFTGEEEFIAKKIWLSTNFESFKINYRLSMESVQVFVNSFKNKKCLVKCKEVFPSFVCYNSLGNYINLKIIFHIYE